MYITSFEIQILVQLLTLNCNHEKLKIVIHVGATPSHNIAKEAFFQIDKIIITKFMPFDDI